MPNMGSIIKQHNPHIMKVPVSSQTLCNCRNRDDCPLDGKCLTSCFVYEATVSVFSDEFIQDMFGSSDDDDNDNEFVGFTDAELGNGDPTVASSRDAGDAPVAHGAEGAPNRDDGGDRDRTKIYYGACEGQFKGRFYNHSQSFRNRAYESDTELSKFIWTLHDRNVGFSVKWRIAAPASPYRCGTRRCDLCITEKTIIARSNHKGLLNKRTELISKCRHRNKFILGRIKS